MATTWIALTADDLKPYLVQAQLNALRTAALASGQADPFTEIMPDVVKTVRAMIESCPENSLSLTTNSIPPSLKTHVTYLITEAMQLRLPSFKLTEEQKKAADIARDYLKRVAACDYGIEIPADPTTTPETQSGAGISVVSYAEKKATRKTLSGL